MRILSFGYKNPTGEKPLKKFVCEICDFYSNNKKDYKRHCATNKHMKKAQILSNNGKNKKPRSYICSRCKKIYKHSSGLSKHKHKCKYKGLTDKEIKELEAVKKLQEDKELEEKKIKTDEEIEKDNIILTMLEVIKKQQETAEKTNQILKQQTERATNVYNNCQTKNQQFNINVFLNSECKDAMNLTDFVKNVKVTLEDLKFTSDNGYERGITHLITKHLKDLPVTERPIHCSGDNSHLPQFYVKDENKWEEDKEHKKLDKSIHDVSMKQIDYLKEWERVHPNFKNNEELMETWHKMVGEIIGSCSKQEKDAAKNNIKKSLGNHIHIEDAMLENK
jgi:hypothetical protein